MTPCQGGGGGSLRLKYAKKLSEEVGFIVSLIENLNEAHFDI